MFRILSIANIKIMKKPVSITKAIYGSFTGISPVIANEICYRASIDGDMPVDSLDADAVSYTHLDVYKRQGLTPSSA